MSIQNSSLSKISLKYEGEKKVFQTKGRLPEITSEIQKPVVSKILLNTEANLSKQWT